MTIKAKTIKINIINYVLNKYYPKNDEIIAKISSILDQKEIDINVFYWLFNNDIFSEDILKNDELLNNILNNLNLEQIDNITYSWKEDAYDIEVDKVNTYVANDIVVSNCIFQEQIMQMAQDLAGYTLGEADILRRAIWKKKKKVIEEQREIFVEKASNLWYDKNVVSEIYNDMILPAAEYSFNKCLTKDTKILLANWEYRTIEELIKSKNYKGLELYSLNIDDYKSEKNNYIFELDNIVDIHINWIKDVYKMTLKNWMYIKSTDNHNFLTIEGWKELKDIWIGGKVVVNNTEIDKNVLFDEVISIEYIWKEETFDLEINKNHNFIANWIITHNSHAACYAYIAYQWAYLKSYYPAEYIVSVLMSQWDDLERTAIAIEDAYNHNIKIQYLDVNKSNVEYEFINDKKIALWLKLIKWVWEADLQKIVDERNKGWKYTSFDDFIKRNKLILNKKILAWLLYSGALDELIDQNTGIENIEAVLAYSKKEKKTSNAQVNLFTLFDSLADDKSDSISTLVEMKDPIKKTNNMSLSLNEFASTWLMIKNHPFNWIKTFIEEFELNRDTLHWAKNSSLLKNDKLEVRWVAMIMDLMVNKTNAWKTLVKLKLLWTDYYISAMIGAELLHKYEYELVWKSKENPSGIYKMIEYVWKYSVNEYWRSLFITDINFKDINQAYNVAQNQGKYNINEICDWKKIFDYKNEILNYEKTASILIAEYLLKPENAEMYKEKLKWLKDFLTRHHSPNWEYNIILKTYDWAIKETGLKMSNKDLLINHIEKTSWFKIVWIKKSSETDTKK